MSQMKETREQALERVKPLLTEGELYAFNYWQNSKQDALAASLNVKLFQLFLNGKKCEEIRRLNPAISLGQIVAARVEGDWDRRREEYLDSLLNETTQRVQQATMSTAQFVCDLLAVASAEHGDKLQRYIQTGDSRELGEFKIDTLTGLKTTIEILQKLTGQEKQSKITLAGEVLHTSNPTEKQEPTSEQASTVLKLLLGSKK